MTMPDQPTSTLLQIVARSAVWGWACVATKRDLLRTYVRQTAKDAVDAASYARGPVIAFGPPSAVPVLLLGDTVIVITEEDLAALGPCPGL